MLFTIPMNFSNERAATLGLSLFSTLLLLFSATFAFADPQDRITICHATASATNPYVIETPSKNSIINDVGVGHGASGINIGDIIPPFDYDTGHYPGQNWTAAGQAIWNADCDFADVPGGGSSGSGTGGDLVGIVLPPVDNGPGTSTATTTLTGTVVATSSNTLTGTVVEDDDDDNNNGGGGGGGGSNGGGGGNSGGSVAGASSSEPDGMGGGGEVLGASTEMPLTPNTGAGGLAAETTLTLILSALVALISGLYWRKQMMR